MEQPLLKTRLLHWINFRYGITGCELAEKDPEAAQRLVRQHVLEFDRYRTEVELFRATRRELLLLVGRLRDRASTR